MELFLLLVNFIYHNYDITRYFFYSISIILGRMVWVFFRNTGVVKMSKKYTSRSQSLLYHGVVIFFSVFLFDIISTVIGEKFQSKLFSMGIIFGIFSENIIIAVLNNFDGIMKEALNRFLIQPRMTTQDDQSDENHPDEKEAD